MKKSYLPWLIFLFVIVIGCQMHSERHYPFVFWGFAVEGFPITEHDLELLQRETKVFPDMVLFYMQWPAPNHQNPSIIRSLEAIWTQGAVPCLTWELMNIGDQIETTIPYEDIINGLYDPYLYSIINEVKLWGKPLVIRFAHEMNLSKYHWGTPLNDFGPQSPEIYKKIFQYVVEKFKKEQVTNVLWAFCPNVDSIPRNAWNIPRNYYPGDQYVDLLGMDGYDWDISSESKESQKLLPTSSRYSFEQIFKPLYQQLKQIAPHKPMIVFETASAGQKQAQWIQDALKISKEWGIEGIIWFQAKKEVDWKIRRLEDDSNTPLIKASEPSFQMWLLNHLNDFK